MNIVSLRTFLAVIQTGNLNKAAEQLNVTQSTVSTRIDTLEQSLGQRLLVRSRRGAELTKAGFAFQRHAELIVQTWDVGRKRIGLPRGFSGTFSITCDDDLWEGLGERILEQLEQTQPDLAIELWRGEPEQTRRWLSSGLVDLALVSEPIAGPDLVLRRVGNDRLVQVATVPRKVVPWHPDYIFVDLGAEFRRDHTRTWPVNETTRITFAASRWALDYLLTKGGSAFLPWRMARDHVAAGRLFPVDGTPEFERPVYLVWREASAEMQPWINDLPALLDQGA
jgi:DNA-binding transcriptional LysR family regulator